MRRLLLAFVLLVAVAPPAIAAPTRTSGALALDVDLDAGSFDVEQRVVYVNDTGRTLDELVFHVVPATYGAFTLRGARADGRTVEPTRAGTVGAVPLPARLGPSERADVSLDFHLRLPSPGTNRFGLNAGVLALGNFYPVLSIYRDGWDHHQYAEIGNAFVTGIADYDVAVRLDRAAATAHSGLAVGSGATWLRATGAGLRDFALAISSRYVVREPSAAGVPIPLYTTPEHSFAIAELARTDGEVVAWGSRRLGSFPHVSLVIAETVTDNLNWVRQEYPGLVFISSVAIPGGGVGDAAFFELCRAFVADNAGRIARGPDFLHPTIAPRGESVAALVRRYFSYPNLTSPAASATNCPIAGSHFFAEANGRGGEGRTGYAVTNAGEVRLYDEFVRLGAAAALGFPASHRFEIDGFTVPVVQKAVLQWRPELGRTHFKNVLDRLTDADLDRWLAASRLTPPPDNTRDDTGLPWDTVIRRHRRLLDRSPALRTAYLGSADWLDRYGLPMSYAEYPDVRVVRGQRAVLQEWTTERPWARAGEVTVANGGDLMKESGLVPPLAVAPSAPPG